jgi:hypothetical protein
MKVIELTLRVTLRLERTDVNGWERTLLEARRQAGAQLAQAVLAALEREALGAVAGCPRCGGAWRRNGEVPRVLEMLLGRVVWKRVRLRCARCGAERYPLDEVLGLSPRTKHTLGVEEVALWLAAEMSYEKTEAALAKLAALAVSTGTLHAMVREEGARLQAQDEAERQAVFERGVPPPPSAARPELLVVQADGTGLRNRATHSSMESKVGVVYSDTVPISHQRRVLVDRRTVASLESAERFGQRLWLAAQRCGVEHAGRVIFVSDGAHWCPTVQQTHFPEALYVLDRWHLERAIREALTTRHRSIAALLRDAMAGRPEPMVARLRRLVRSAHTPEERERRQHLLDYVAFNAEGIRNLARSPVIGSGPVEKQVDVLLCRRLKTRGMSWYRPGAAALQRLRELKLNGEWHTYWQARDRAQARSPA